jgi:hypothetical protein
MNVDLVKLLGGYDSALFNGVSLGCLFGGYILYVIWIWLGPIYLFGVVLNVMYLNYKFPASSAASDVVPIFAVTCIVALLFPLKDKLGDEAKGE